MYYRVEIQVDPLPTWQWRSTVLSSLQTLFYSFTLPNSAPQVRAWMKLLSRVQNGAFQP